MSRFSNHIRHNIVGYVALFFALTMGTAYATHPGGEGTISTEDIQNLAVTNPKLAAQAVSTGKLADDAVTHAKIRSGAVRNRQLDNGVVRSAKVAEDAIRGRHILDGTVTAAKLADGAVTHAKLGCAGNDPDDEMVRVGPVCIDRYEASIWDAPVGGNQIVGAIPCNANGQNCTDIYARSVAGVAPTRFITWFQAQQALANSGKRLPTNAEWQMAVAGTPPDTGEGTTPCTTRSADAQNTGSNPDCISNHGVNDMVGNLREWVADWDEEAFNASNWPAGFGGDLTRVGRGSEAASTGFLAALIRGGQYNDATSAGPFAVLDFRPSFANNEVGFRGAR